MSDRLCVLNLNIGSPMRKPASLWTQTALEGQSLILMERIIPSQDMSLYLLLGTYAGTPPGDLEDAYISSTSP